MNRASLLLLCIISLSLAACGKAAEQLADTDTARFAATPQITPVLAPINEASGIADSRSGDYLWVIEDSGNPAELLSLKKDGTKVNQFKLSGAVNVDWEDLALSNGDLFIADIGDNAGQRASCVIYQVREPDAAGSEALLEYRTIQFRYPDMPHDAEALLVDPLTKDLFVITKRDAASMVFKISYPYSYTEINTATLTGTLPFNGVTGAAISKTGQEILLKTYLNIYSFTRGSTETVDKALRNTPKQLSYQVEPQGEAITFAHDHSGFYTLSEKGMSNSVNIHFYQRK